MTASENVTLAAMQDIPHGNKKAHSIPILERCGLTFRGRWAKWPIAKYAVSYDPLLSSLGRRDADMQAFIEIVNGSAQICRVLSKLIVRSLPATIRSRPVVAYDLFQVPSSLTLPQGATSRSTARAATSKGAT